MTRSRSRGQAYSGGVTELPSQTTPRSRGCVAPRERPAHPTREQLVRSVPPATGCSIGNTVEDGGREGPELDGHDRVKVIELWRGCGLMERSEQHLDQVGNAPLARSN